MRLKEGVKLEGVSWRMFGAAIIVEGVCVKYSVPCVITSANDSKHSAASLHYKGLALDFRTKFPALDGREQEFRSDIAAALGPDFDVVMEAVGTDNEHAHIEYDPHVV